MYHTKKIGVFISHIFGYYQKNVCQGIIDKANEFGYSVEIFTSLDGEHIEKHTLGENHILEIPNYDMYCGIIFASGTYLSVPLKEEIRNFLKHHVSCPTIEITSSTPSFPCITLENNLAAQDVVSHFVHVHNAKRICYLGSSTEEEISLKRLSNVEIAMKKEQLSLGSYDVFSCENKPEAVNGSLSFFLKDGPLDAIICYNDALALTFMQQAIKRGFKIPNDFAISGFDDTSDGNNVIPALTSVTFPVYELGTTAIIQLMNVLQDKPIPAQTTITAKLCIKESCGCKNHKQKNPIFHIQNLNHYISNLESSMIKTMSMSNEFQHITEIDNGMLLLHKYIAYIDGCREFYLCLSSDWDNVDSDLLSFEQSSDLSLKSSSSDYILKLGVKNGSLLPECTFKKNELIPNIFQDDSIHSYVFTPLFFEDKSFGYIALAYENNQIDYHFQLISWVMNINQMLQSIRKYKFATYMEQKIEDLYLKDPSSGFYNMQGLYYLSHTLFEKYNLLPTTVSSIYFSIENLPDITKEFGSSQKLFALEVFSHALTAQLPKDCYCFQFFENEFYVLIFPSNTDVDSHILQKINRYLNNYNALSSKDYSIHIVGKSASKNLSTNPTIDFFLSLFELAKNQNN